MRVGKEVQLAVDDFEHGEIESAMAHACAAIEGTAGKVWPRTHDRPGSKRRFTTLLRDNYDVMRPMLGGLELVHTRYPVEVESKPTASDGKVDFADLVYAVHRCTHAHGDELPPGSDMLTDANVTIGLTRLTVVNGAVQLSDRTIFALLAVAVLAPLNADQQVPDGYHLTLANERFAINKWWGRKESFLAAAAKHPMGPEVILDFGDWMIGY
ncbi:MAG: hypothetical protein LC790_04865 [Actinobacteria bacterium]|nr:hypothetical protein [Actinomycetota bacterium]